MKPADKKTYLKKPNISRTAGRWKGTSLDNDNLWKTVLKRRSRKKPIDF